VTLVIHFFTTHIHASAVLFQYHKKYQYPIHDLNTSCCAVPLSCARSLTILPHHFYHGDYKLRPLKMYQSENHRACYMFPVKSILIRVLIHSNATPSHNKSHRYSTYINRTKYFNITSSPIMDITHKEATVYAQMHYSVFHQQPEFSWYVETLVTGRFYHMWDFNIITFPINC
jgi:hypothetical protein